MPAPRAATAKTLTAAVTATVAAALVLSGCSSSGGKSDSSAAAGSSKASTAAAHVVNVTVTAAKGCVADAAQYAAGALTFKITNTDATAVSEVELLSGERIVGEKENLPPGFSGVFAVNVDAGSYTLYCPGATPERSPLKVVGKSVGTTDTNLAALLKTATTGYANYVNTQVNALVAATATFNKALHGTNLKAAQTAYMQARPYYEKIEPVAESFVIGQDSIDADIDVRIADTTFAKWRGFHRIEYGIFKQKSLKGMGVFGDKLVADVGRLKKLTTGLTYKPTELANGAQGLLDEVAASKITGEEEAYSQIDLLDFANNDEGAEQAFAQLQPALTKIDPVLTRNIQTQFAALDKLVNSYRTTSNPSGFTLYTELTATDKRQLAAAVKAVQEPLSTVASKVANA
ncbi:iron uptake system protein EfeO [uncultured Jatrophihabitans sp.]|uniref:iron uptake system protein EfeO n=1 Tax=uncultured Jatrophihabitans sp. TaxID=1610747 RepID=UPI0035CAD29F